MKFFFQIVNKEYLFLKSSQIQTLVTSKRLELLIQNQNEWNILSFVLHDT